MVYANENLVPCPCCGEGLVEANHEFDICDVCGWEDDDYQFNHPDYRGGANPCRLTRHEQLISCGAKTTMPQLKEQKKILRRDFLSRRAAIPRDERDRISHELIKKFLATEIYRTSKTVMAYASTPDEIQLDELFAACFADEKILAIPFIVGKGDMRAVVVPNLDALEVGAFNIMTIKRELRKFIEPAQIDCVIVPGAAFDIHGGRLGLGGGYYDRFLPRAVNAKKIALAYDFQVVDSLPIESHDVKVDAILTIKKIFVRCSSDEVL